MSPATATMTAAEYDAFMRAIEREAPSLVSLAAGQRGVTAISQPWFARHRIWCVQLLDVVPPKPIHVAISEETGRLSILTTHLDRVNDLVASDPPPRLETRAAAERYALAMDAWTVDSPFGELTVSTTADIPYREQLDDVDEMIVQLIERFAAEKMHPRRTRRYVDGYAVQWWLIENRRLVFRTLQVGFDGRLTRHEQTIHAELPVPAGRHWAERDGRLVPVA